MAAMVWAVCPDRMLIAWVATHASAWGHPRPASTRPRATGWAARRGACWAGPFPRGLPPNHAGTFRCTWLSSDLRRGGGGLPVMDGVVAGAADHQGLAPLPGHDGHPRGLACSGFAEAGEVADLVHEHSARVPAQLAPSGKEPGDQFLARVGDPAGDAVSDDRVLVACEGYPAEPGDQWLLAVAFDPGLVAMLPAPLSGDRTARNGCAHRAWSDARAAGCTALPAAMGEDRHRHRPSWSRHAFGGGSHARRRGAAHTCQARDRPARAADGP